MARSRRSSNNLNRHPIFYVVPYLVLISLLSSIVLAADDDTALLPSSTSSSFPACGLKCPVLNQAQDTCVPPAAPKTDHATYVSCFCQSDLLTKLHSSGDGTCDDQCTSGADRTLLQSWYKTYCDSGGKEPASTSTTTTTSATNTATSTKSNSSKNLQNPAPQPWIKTHYGWVIMVVILIVAFTAIGVGATLLKRRHDAKNSNLYLANGGDNSGVLFKHSPQNASTPGADPVGTWPLPPGFAQPGSSRYTDPFKSMPGSSRTATASPKPYGIASSQPSGSGNVEVREVQK